MFQKDRTWLTSTRCSASLLSRETQTETCQEITLPSKMVTIKKTNNVKHWEGYRTAETLVCFLWVHLLQKTGSEVKHIVTIRYSNSTTRYSLQININIYPREMAKRKLETVKFLFDGLFFFLFLLFQNKKHCLN